MVYLKHETKTMMIAIVMTNNDHIGSFLEWPNEPKMSDIGRWKLYAYPVVQSAVKS